MYGIIPFMNYVIACGDEGVQVNEGTRVAVLGAGVRLNDFSQVVPHLKSVFGNQLRIAANEENAWIKQQFDLSTFEQADASMQQQAQVLADQEGLLYSGFIPFADPQPLEHDIKAHMVRPRGIHIANKIVLTLGGGEQTYHLGHYLISADWVSEASDQLVKSFLSQQIEFYRKLAKQEIAIELELGGELGEEKAAANQAKLQAVGLI